MDAPPPSGKFSVSWTIADEARTVSCDEVGALVVSIEITSPALGGGFVEAFTCGPGINSSRSLPVGLYDLNFELVGRSGSLGTLPSQRLMVSADAVTEAQPLRFPVKAEGLLDTRMVAGATANCAAGAGGANLAAISLLLERQGGACVPTTFVIGPGAGRPGFNYDSACPTPAPTAVCVERDQAITATTGSGSYVLRARGIVGLGPIPAPARCWSADQLIDVPPEQRTLRVDVGMTYLKGTPGCP